MCWRRAIEVRPPRTPPWSQPQVHNGTSMMNVTSEATCHPVNERPCDQNITLPCVSENGVCCILNDVGSPYCACKSGFEGNYCQSHKSSIDDYDEFEVHGGHRDVATNALIGSLFVAVIFLIVISAIAIFFVIRYRRARSRPNNRNVDKETEEGMPLNDMNGGPGHDSSRAADDTLSPSEEAILNAQLCPENPGVSQIVANSPKSPAGNPGLSWQRHSALGDKSPRTKSLPEDIDHTDQNGNVDKRDEEKKS